MKKRIKQYSFWTGLSAAVVLLVGNLAKAFGFQFKEEIVADIIMSICGILVVFGVVNAPYIEDETTDKNKNNNSDEEKVVDDSSVKESETKETKIEDTSVEEDKINGIDFDDVDEKL